MKTPVITAAMLCALAAAPAFIDDQSADPNDPCAMVLCLDGGSPAECDPMYKTFMSIKKKNKHGFLPDHTADARRDKLNQYPFATVA